MGHPFGVCKFGPLSLLFICFLCPECPLLCHLLLTWSPLTSISGLALGYFLAEASPDPLTQGQEPLLCGPRDTFITFHSFLTCVSSGLCIVFYSLLHVSRCNLHRLKCSAIKPIVQSVRKKERQGPQPQQQPIHCFSLPQPNFAYPKMESDTPYLFVSVLFTQNVIF